MAAVLLPEYAASTSGVLTRPLLALQYIARILRWNLGAPDERRRQPGSRQKRQPSAVSAGPSCNGVALPTPPAATPPSSGNPAARPVGHRCGTGSENQRWARRSPTSVRAARLLQLIASTAELESSANPLAARIVMKIRAGPGARCST
jgi:hypothetical protein